MKAKMACLGILLAGLISACGVTDSKKTPEPFNPQVDGLWKFGAIVTVSCGEDPLACDKAHDITWVSIDYPHLHACYERLSTYDGHLIKARKEDVEVAHTSQNLYSITTDNGDTVSSDTAAIKIKKWEDGDLGIVKKVPEGEWEGYNYNYVGANETNEAYRECRKNATYSKKTLYL